MRKTLPGSFSEEDDAPVERLKATEIWQVDPVDGTGDFVDTYATPRVFGATTLVSKLIRDSASEPFKPIGGLIFDTINQIALISDGETIELYKADEKRALKKVPYESTAPEVWTRGETVKINRRPSYPQLTFDGAFMTYLGKHGVNIERVNVGGAGTVALQLFRNYIQPTDPSGKAFADLAPIDICFNAQPDWKSWDTDPTDVIANALGLPKRTDIFGNKLYANASANELAEMHHTEGYVLSTSKELQIAMTANAQAFVDRNPDCSLLQKDYDFKTAIMNMAQGK